MNERPVKKPRPVVVRPPEPRIIVPPPEHEGIIETVARPTELIGWG